MSIYGLDLFGHDVIRGYGVCHLPLTTGHHEKRYYSRAAVTRRARRRNARNERNRLIFLYNIFISHGTTDGSYVANATGNAHHKDLHFYVRNFFSKIFALRPRRITVEKGRGCTALFIDL